MAVARLNFASESLKMHTDVVLFFPDPKQSSLSAPAQRKTVYLLHGLSEDCNAWLRMTNAARYARSHELNLVMPSGGRSMYCDNVNGQNYFTYITTELPEYLHDLFGLSTDREKTMIAGASMGGYGAARAGLTCPERYGAWCSLSGPLDLSPLLSRVDDALRSEFPFLIRAADSLDTTELNPVNLIDPERHAKQTAYIACGTNDDLLACTQLFEQRASSAGLSYLFSYGEGRHDWSFWDAQIQIFFDLIAGDLQ